MTTYGNGKARSAMWRRHWTCALLVLACFAGFAGFAGLVGCTGGVPSIPEAPNEILKKADGYFQRGKYWPSSELYKAFLAKYPGDDRSDYAQFMLAESYFNDEEYPLAAVEYRILVSNYGYSDYVDDGYFREGVCLYEQCPKPALDQTKCYEALDKFNRFVQIFPNSPLIYTSYTGD